MKKKATTTERAALTRSQILARDLGQLSTYEINRRIEHLRAREGEADQDVKRLRAELTSRIGAVKVFKEDADALEGIGESRR